MPTLTAAVRRTAERLLASMTLEQKVGQVFMLGFEGTAVTPTNRALVRDLHLGGVTLFTRNVQDPVQLACLTRDLQAIADPIPLFVSVDQEGGLVVRVTRVATVFPGNMALGATGDPDLARRVACAQGAELLAMGVNMNLAPVLDVNTNPRNPVIGIRAFGSQPDVVGRFGMAAVQGLQSAGVSAVAKHFPGHGDTAVDSHLALPLVPHGLERLDRVELPPFRAAVTAGVDGIMTAHVHLPAIERRHSLPATLSRAVLTGLLRERLGYQGLILTDALDMHAIKDTRSAAEAAVLAFEAGADLLLVAGITPEDRDLLPAAPRALLAAVRDGRVSEARLDESVLRVLATKARRGIVGGDVTAPVRPPLDVVGGPEHRELALEAARRAVTLVHNRGGLLPLRADKRVLVVSPEYWNRSKVEDDEHARSLGIGLAQRGQADEMRVEPSPSMATVMRVLERARGADVVVLASYDLAQQPAQADLADALAEAGKPVILVMLRGPYDADSVPHVGAALAGYGDRPVHLQALAEALYGAFAPTGRIP